MFSVKKYFMLVVPPEDIIVKLNVNKSKITSVTMFTKWKTTAVIITVKDYIDKYSDYTSCKQKIPDHYPHIFLEQDQRMSMNIVRLAARGLAVIVNRPTPGHLSYEVSCQDILIEWRHGLYYNTWAGLTSVFKPRFNMPRRRSSLPSRNGWGVCGGERRRSSTQCRRDTQHSHLSSYDF